ncbi:3'(2'),5'-bisphosphate nucleotidase CysQ [Nevskia soli]|uniref:3'(2'),5'-bisphosphate nucleotidase CysQ n=1 Tax=Nevskia soli TaxID=418856 RepID=UPI0004A6C914|nr:3'(2'),5'-bisphosphate nucleotidase CysQ [Nevskia soli]
MIDQLIGIALQAGAAILPVYERMKPEEATLKGDGSPVTVADALAESIILEQLGSLAPQIPVVAEESVAAGRIPQTAGKPFFLVDPLDGTKEFLSRNGDFTVNIALIEDGVPVLGVVYAPAIGELYAGGVGQGARRALVKDGKRGPWTEIHVRPVPPGGIKVQASRSHLTEETKTFIERFKVAEFVSAGSSLKFCRVAAGEADLYPRLARTMEWDTAAADAVLRAAGGKVLDMEGRPLAYGKRNQPTDSDFANGWFVATGTLDPFAAR